MSQPAKSTVATVESVTATHGGGRFITIRARRSRYSLTAPPEMEVREGQSVTVILGQGGRAWMPL